VDLAVRFGIPNSLNGHQQSVGNALTNFLNANGGITGAFAALTPARLWLNGYHRRHV